jgi:hypothetical protein
MPSYLRSFLDVVIPALLGVVMIRFAGDARRGRTQPADNQAAATSR